jgi:hypothetical protein
LDNNRKQRHLCHEELGDCGEEEVEDRIGVSIVKGDGKREKK